MKRTAKGKQKKPNKGFERTNKEWEQSIAGHIGKFIDGLRVPDVIELILYGGLAYLGYEASGRKPIGLLWGPVSFRLATTMGGTPPVSQIAGLASLGMLGLAFVAPAEIPIKTSEPTIIKVTEGPGAGQVKDVICPVGSTPIYIFGAGWKCVDTSGSFWNP